MYRKQKEEQEQLEKEYKFARWFWNQADSASWQTTKIFVTLVACGVISLLGFIAVNSFSLMTAAIFAGIIFILVLITNLDIRQAVVGFLTRHRSHTGLTEITAYANLKYYFIENHTEILFLENGKDLTGIGLYKLKAVPLVIKGNFERFIRSLYQQQIPIWWSYVQAPVDQGAILAGPAVSAEAQEHYADQPPSEFESRVESRNGIWVARLIFGTRRTVSAINGIEGKRMTLYQQLSADLIKIQTAFFSAYPHTVLELLQGKELVKALSIAITGGGVPAFF